MRLISYIELDAFGILILFFFWQNQRRSGNLSLEDHLFNGILIVTIVEQLMDAGQWLLEGVFFTGSYALQVFCYTLGHAIAPVISCLWAMYCDLRANMDERGLRRRIPLYFFPILLHVAVLTVNLFIPLVFRVDSAHLYHRDRFFGTYILLLYLYGAVSLVLLIRKAFQPDLSVERTEYRYMALFILPPLIGGALQWMFYGLSLIWVCVVLSIVMVYTSVLSRQISTDPLTGLNNRRKFNRYLTMKINSGEANRSLFLMMMDADGFKDINDNYGHVTGDHALMVIAEILKNLCLNRDCFLARLGGDEFVILGHDQEGLSPEILTGQIEEQVSLFNASAKESFWLSLSIGWARFDAQKVNSVDALLNAADQSMYLIKAARRERPPKPQKRRLRIAPPRNPDA